MRLEVLKIEDIAALLWGWPEDKVIIAVHGSQSHKCDEPIFTLSQHANTKAAGYQMVSFDLPGHGERRGEDTLCDVETCVAELKTVMDWAKERWPSVSLFANSIGAYFSLMAYADEPLEKAWFLSPLVDMRRMIEDMFGWFGITEEQLRCEGEIPTPGGETLYWDYYTYVRDHPVSTWNVPTDILYGAEDDTCSLDTIEAFAARFGCGLEILPACGHYFHTPEEIKACVDWMKRTGLIR